MYKWSTAFTLFTLIVHCVGNMNIENQLSPFFKMCTSSVRAKTLNLICKMGEVKQIQQYVATIGLLIHLYVEN